MSAYINKIQNHPIFLRIKEIEEEIISARELDNLSSIDVESFARISYVIENFLCALDTCDKNLVVESWLNDAVNAITNIKNYINSFKNNKNSNALQTNCFTQLDLILQTTAKLNCVKSKQSLRGLMSAISKYTEVMDNHTEQLSQKVTELSDEIEKQKEKITSYETQSMTSLEGLQKTINEERKRLDGFASTYQSQMADDNKSFSSMVEVLKEKFSITQEERKKDFETEIEHIKNAQKEIEETSRSQREEIGSAGTALIDEYKQIFEEYKNQVVDIVGVINTNMFSYKYKEVADDAQKRAGKWHLITMLLMMVISIFAMLAFVSTINTDTNWVKLVAKIFTTTTLATGAAYAARQASKQEKVERYARKIEMELVSIDPFIESLDEKQRSEIKEELSKKLFGNTDAMGIGNKDEAYPVMDKLASVENTMQSLISLVTKLTKKE